MPTPVRTKGPTGRLRTSPTPSASPTRSSAAELLSASGGDLVLGRTAVEAAASADFAVDLSSRGFADYVASLAPAPALDLSTADVWVARVLAHLSSFTEQTAPRSRSPPSPPASRRSSGTPRGCSCACAWPASSSPTGNQAADGTCACRRRSPPPSRRDVAPTEEEGLISRLVAVLNDHLESAEAVEPAILSDVLTLARRAGLWHDLVRLSESIGLPMFLLTPASACMAFAGLPAEAPRCGTRARTPLTAGRGRPRPPRRGVGEGTIREEERARPSPPRPGRGGCGSSSSRPGRRRVCAPTVSRRAGEAPADGRLVPESDAATPLETIRAIAELAAAGRHAEAVELGLSARVRPGARRAQLTIRLLTAISAVHDSRLSKALSILHDVEGQASVRHVDGDFLLPAALAWSALAAATGADHERADRLLARLAGQPPTLVDDMVHPAWSAAAAVRALDRLNLEGARRRIDDLAAAPQGWGLQAIVPVLGRILAVLSATTESARSSPTTRSRPTVSSRSPRRRRGTCSARAAASSSSPSASRDGRRSNSTRCRRTPRSAWSRACGSNSSPAASKARSRSPTRGSTIGCSRRRAAPTSPRSRRPP
ncbi:hypothetical protein IOD13_15015 [Brevibacterium casei]|nr:hypothetical protein [Brevibacterium casei]